MKPIKIIKELSIWDLDTISKNWSEQSEIILSASNLAKIYRKQQEVIKTINQIIEHFNLDPIDPIES